MCKNVCVKRRCQSMISYVVGQKTPSGTVDSSKSVETEPYEDTEDVSSVNSGDNGNKTLHIDNSGICKIMYGKQVPRNSAVCSGCNGARDEEAAEEEIILCDGEG